LALLVAGDSRIDITDDVVRKKQMRKPKMETKEGFGYCDDNGGKK
jgi:hypothetical protein